MDIYLKHILKLVIGSVTDIQYTDTKNQIQALDSRSLQSEVELKDKKSLIRRVGLKCSQNAVKNLDKRKYFTRLVLNSIAYCIALIINGLSFLVYLLFKPVLLFREINQLLRLVSHKSSRHE